MAEKGFKIKKGRHKPTMPIRQSSGQWVGGDLPTRQLNYRKEPKKLECDFNFFSKFFKKKLPAKFKLDNGGKMVYNKIRRLLWLLNGKILMN